MLEKELREVGIKNEDLPDIVDHGLSQEIIIFQLQKIKSHNGYINIVKAATEKNGIFSIDNGFVTVRDLAGQFEEKKCFPIKFTPMSGVASRMFAFLERYIAGDPKEGDTGRVQKFIHGLDKNTFSHNFPFLPQLESILSKGGHDLERLIGRRQYREIIEHVLYKKGLSLSHLPKALLPFFSRNGRLITPLEEHMWEAHLYGRDILHITVNPIYEDNFKNTVQLIKKNEKELEGVSVEISYQETSTDSVAISAKTGNVVRDENGKIVFFPAGHGSLIYNIEKLGCPAFIRNVDNVAINETHRRVIEVYHEACAVLLCNVKELIKDVLVGYQTGSTEEEHLDEALEILEQMGFHVHINMNAYREASFDAKKKMVKEGLDRPIKIVGVVKNQGDPGGGPFIIDYKEREIVSIVEKDEISPDQRFMMSEGKYFNPVDLLVDQMDWEGKPYKLHKYLNSQRYFVVQKSYDGDEIIRLENPGLWNGAMDGWNSLFVEFPRTLFSPVKEINDLLGME